MITNLDIAHDMALHGVSMLFAYEAARLAEDWPGIQDLMVLWLGEECIEGKADVLANLSACVEDIRRLTSDD